MGIGNPLATMLRYEWHALGNGHAALDWMADPSPILFQAIARNSGMPVDENLEHASAATLAATR